MDREAMEMLREATDTLRKILEHLTTRPKTTSTCWFCGGTRLVPYQGAWWGVVPPPLVPCPYCSQPVDQPSVAPTVKWQIDSTEAPDVRM